MMFAAVALASCTEMDFNDGRGRGNLTLKVTSDGGLNSVPEINVKSGNAPEVDEGNFDVVITKKTGEPYRTFKLGEMPEVLEMIPGNYVISVTSPDRLPAGWEQPVYGTEREFVVVRNSITPLELRCTIQNVKVSVNCSDKFLAEVTDYSIIVSNGTGSLTWNEAEVTEGQTGWFEPSTLTVFISGHRAIDPTEVAELDFKIKDVNPADHIILNIDAKTTGTLEVVVDDGFIDDSLNDKDVAVEVPGFPETPVDRPEPEEPENPDAAAPTLSWPANPDFEVMTISDEMDINLIVDAPGKIKGFVVIVSDNFADIVNRLGGVDGKMDLIGNEQLVENLAAMLPTGDKLLDKTKVDFPLSGLVPMIGAVGNPDENYDFTLEVTDGNGKKLVKTLTFYNPSKNETL